MAKEMNVMYLDIPVHVFKGEYIPLDTIKDGAKGSKKMFTREDANNLANQLDELGYEFAWGPLAAGMRDPFDLHKNIDGFRYVFELSFVESIGIRELAPYGSRLYGGSLGEI